MSLRYWFRQSYSLMVTAGAASLILSLLAILTQDAVNSDGICYLRSAAAVLRLHTPAMHLCGQGAWPFYQMLIAGVAVLTRLPLPAAAGLLNATFSLGTVLIFVGITFNLTRHTRIRWLSVAVILTAHHFNAFRPDVIRDHGYWFFYLLSVYWLLHFVDASDFKQRFVSAVFWGFSLFTATLFRLEGAVSLILLPWFVFILPHRTLPQKVGAFFCLNSVLLMLLPLTALWLASHPLQSLGRFDYLVSQMTHGGQLLLDHWQVAVGMMKEQVLSVYSAPDAAYILALALTAYYILGLLDVLTPGGFVLVIYALWRRSAGIAQNKLFVLVACAFVNVILTSFFLAQNFFLARRYMMALSFILMLAVPFALDDLIRQWPKRRWPLVLAVLVLAASAAGGLHRFGPSNSYVRASGEWLALHTAETDRIYSNDEVVLYYAGRPDRELFRQDRTPNDSLCAYDWLALRLKNHENRTVDSCAVFVREFHNRHGGTVRVYRVVNHRGST